MVNKELTLFCSAFGLSQTVTSCIKYCWSGYKGFQYFLAPRAGRSVFPWLLSTDQPHPTGKNSIGAFAGDPTEKYKINVSKKIEQTFFLLLGNTSYHDIFPLVSKEGSIALSSYKVAL